MKILMIHPRETSFHKDKVLGGLETVFRNQMIMLSNAKHDVHIFVSKDSDDYPGVTVLKTTVNSKFKESLSAIKFNKEFNKCLLSVLENCEYDIILNHSNMANGVIAALCGTDIPSITYIHNCVSVAGGMAIFPFMEALEKYNNSGGTIMNVSQTSMNEWSNVFVKKYNKPSIFTKFHYTPVAFSKPVVNESEGYGLMVSRISPDKKIHRIVDIHNQIGIPFVLCHTTPTRDSEIEYMKEVNKVSGLQTIFKENLPRTDIMDVISRAKYLVVSGPESFGLSAYEANLHGVPVILNVSSEHHPVDEIGTMTSVRDAVVRAPRSKTNGFFLHKDELKYSLRVRLSDEMYRRFNEKSSLYNLEALIKDAMIKKEPHKCSKSLFQLLDDATIK